MMKKTGRNYYSKYFKSFLLILAVPLMTILLIFFGARVSVEEQIKENSRRTLEFFFYNVDNVIGTAADTCTSIANSNLYEASSTLFIEQKGKNAYHSWRIAQQLKEHQNEKFHDVFLYYPDNGQVVSMTRSTMLLENYYKAYYADKGEFWEEFVQVTSCPYKKPVLFSMNGNGLDSFQCVAMRRELSKKAKQDFVIVVVLNRDYMKELLLQVENDDNRGNTSFILDNQNEIVFSTENILAEQVKNVYYNGEEFYEGTIDGESYILLSQESKQVDASYVHAVSNRYFENSLWEINVIFTVGMLISLFLGILVARWQTKKIYHPVKQMIDKVQEQTATQWNSEMNTEFEFVEMIMGKEVEEQYHLKNALKDKSELKRYKFIISLLNGKYEFSEKSDDVFEDNGFSLCSDHFCVVILKTKNAGEMEHNLLTFVTANVLDELMESKYVCYVLSLSGDKQVVLINPEGYEEYENIVGLINEGILFLNNKFSIEFTTSISSIQDGLLGIQEAFKEAEYALRYSYLLENEKIIEYIQIKDREFRYPHDPNVQMQRIIMDYLAQNNFEEVQARRLVEECVADYGIDENASLEMVECFKFEAVATINRIIQQEGGWTNEWKDCIKELMAGSSLTVFKEQLVELITKLAKKHEVSERVKDVCVLAKNYIDAHYNDNQLSLAMLGEMVEMTPHYLTTLFRERYKMTIPDYIVRTRIRHAKTLLKNTSYSVQKIAEETGFLESGKLIRVFKRLEGMTPGVYRNYWNSNPDREETLS